MLNQLKSEYLTTICHEIRTPLNGLTGALELLKRSELNYSQNDLVELAVQCSDGLLEVINNVLDFSRIEAGQVELSLNQAELLPIFDQAMLTIAPKATAKSIHLRMLITKTVPLKIVVDRVRVKQILINLLGNAIKFTDRGYILLYVDADENQLVISIEDSGIGVPKSMLPLIFKPYTQCTNDSQGSGLGLSITRSLIRLMNGDIVLNSNFGKGTIVTVTLPIEGRVEPLQLPISHVHAPIALHPQLSLWGVKAIADNVSTLQSPDYEFLSGKLYQWIQDTTNEVQKPLDLPSSPRTDWTLKILVIDDFQASSKIVKQMLTTLGHDAYTASSGFEALKLGSKQVFDLILMDIRMPGMSGLELIKTWRKSTHILDPECYIAALTANTHPDERLQIKQAGFNDYLKKPIKMKTLHNVTIKVSHVQRSRGIDLCPAPDLSRKLLESNDPSLNKKIFDGLYEQLDAAVQCQQLSLIDNMLDHLHAIKGASALAGYTLLSEAAENSKASKVEEKPSPIKTY